MGIRSQNNPLAAYLDVFSNTGTDAAGAAAGGGSGLTATGGVISDYTTGPGDVYRAHIFTSSGALNVTALGSFGNTLEYLVVGGGGGGGGYGGGGGGGGGFRTNKSGHPVVSPLGALTATVQPYAVVVGAGGVGGAAASGSNGDGRSGGNSEFYPPSHNSYPATQFIRGAGGGQGSGWNRSSITNPGGSGGGNGGQNSSPSNNNPAGAAITDPNHPRVQGYAGGYGGRSSSNYSGGGGGGAGAAGTPWQTSGTPGGGPGGDGLPISIDTTTAYFYAGGGGGMASAEGSTTAGNGGQGGAGGGSGGPSGGGSAGANGRNAGEAGARPSTSPGGSAGYSTGSGGGGGTHSGGTGGNGGSGIVVVRYQIGSVTAAKATGGAISFAGGKTVHVFTNSGIFDVTNGPITCDYLVVGGGASGGLGCGAGGGAGGYRTSLPEGPGGPSPSAESTQAIANGPYAVQVGGGGVIAGNGSSNQTFGGAGTFSNIAFPSAIRSEGGGGGGNIGGSGQPGKPGGSGGGGTYPGGSASSGNKQSPHSGTPAPNQGYGGGTTSDPANFGAGGGGGAGGAGTNGTTTDGGDGGTGKQNTVTGVTLSLAGGGGGNIYYPSSTVGDATHGGGQGAPHAGVAPESGPTSIHGHSSTGGGGGGGLRANGPGPSTGIPPGLPSSVIAIAGQGGSGIVLIAYPS